MSQHPSSSRLLVFVGSYTQALGHAPYAHGDGVTVLEVDVDSGVARALALRPRFVLMDEPAAGLHEAEIPAFAEVIRFVHTAFGAGVLLIDHNVALIMDVCDRVHVLDRGTTLAEGTPAEIRRNLDVATAYLGAEGSG